jgi:nitroreductase
MTKAINRRQILIGGAGLGVALGAGFVARAATADLPSSGAAYEPWRDWRNDASEGPAGLVRSAILAANAHDTQPWLFRVAPDRIDIIADESRNLGAMDPFRREMQLSLGCALENLVLAARAQGYAPRVTPTAGILGERWVGRVLSRGSNSARANPRRRR